jgi:ribose-phosphate pyrophosphokinase
VVTDSIPVPPDKRTSKTTVISVAALLGEAIRRIHADQSVSDLFAQSRVMQSVAEGD